MHTHAHTHSHTHPHPHPADGALFPATDDSDTVSASRQRIEDKLVEEYRNCAYYKQTKEELGRFCKPLHCLMWVSVWLSLHLPCVSEGIIRGRGQTTITRSRTITYNTGFFTQFRWVLRRTFHNLLLNPQTSVAQVGMASSEFSFCWRLFLLKRLSISPASIQAAATVSHSWSVGTHVQGSVDPAWANYDLGTR